MALDIVQIPALNDNYNYLLHDAATGTTAVVDPSESRPVQQALEQRGWWLNRIFVTHHHGDHVGGNTALQHYYGCDVVGYAGDAVRIPGITHRVAEGEQVTLGRASARVLFVPGHTQGHIAYYFAEDKALFCGDTLFSMGCGRLFEGTPQEMFHSLAKLKALPQDVLVFCAHEYTEANGVFALSLEPDNPQLQARVKEVKAKRAQGEATVPSTLGVELQTNPFLREDSQEIRHHLGMEKEAAVEVFAEIRRRKDNF